MIKDSMFGFEIEPKKFDLWIGRIPKPPNGYVKFDSNKHHCQSGDCPNCGKFHPGTGYGGCHDHGNTFQDRQVESVMKAMERRDRRMYFSDEEGSQWKPFTELFCTKLGDEDEKNILQC